VLPVSVREAKDVAQVASRDHEDDNSCDRSPIATGVAQAIAAVAPASRRSGTPHPGLGLE